MLTLLLVTEIATSLIFEWNNQLAALSESPSMSDDSSLFLRMSIKWPNPVRPTKQSIRKVFGRC